MLENITRIKNWITKNLGLIVKTKNTSYMQKKNQVKKIQNQIKS